jgi:RNA polymerase sigma-70 factor (ECF subfamily)
MSTIEFDNYFKEVNPLLEGFALKLTQDRERAQELVQETVVRALRYKDHFVVGTNFKAWITTMMRNIFLNQRRNWKRRKTESVPHDSLYYQLNGVHTTENIGIHRIEFQEILSAINRLEDKIRRPFWMYYQGYAYEEIAQELEIPLGTVKSRIFKARKILKEKLSKWNQLGV